MNFCKPTPLSLTATEACAAKQSGSTSCKSDQALQNCMFLYKVLLCIFINHLLPYLSANMENVPYCSLYPHKTRRGLKWPLSSCNI